MEKIRNFNEHLNSIYMTPITSEFIEDKLKNAVLKNVLSGKNLSFDENKENEKVDLLVKTIMQELHDKIDNFIENEVPNLTGNSKTVGFFKNKIN
jgi:hypothetical protein